MPEREPEPQESEEAAPRADVGASPSDREERAWPTTRCRRSCTS